LINTKLKNIMKKYKYIVLISLIGVVLIASSVLATSDQKNQNQLKNAEKILEKLENFELPDIESTKINPSSLFLGPQGQVRVISGEITELGNTTPAVDGVRVWGVNLKVDTGSAKFIPSGISHSALKIGDKINIKGTINKDTGIITASIVHSLATAQQNVSAIQAQITELLKRIRELQQKLGIPLTPLP